VLVTDGVINNNNATAQQSCGQPISARHEEQTRRRDLRYHWNNRQNEGESIEELRCWERTLVSAGGLDGTDTRRFSGRGALMREHQRALTTCVSSFTIGIANAFAVPSSRRNQRR
jgi:hypothetical protein